MVYKLTERMGAHGVMEPVAKKSKDKATVPGRKLAFRSYEYSLASCEHVIAGSAQELADFAPGEGWKNLLVDYVDTERMGAHGVMEPVAKKSKDKATVPGRKLAFRSYEYSLASCEHVIAGSAQALADFAPGDGWKNLLVDYVDHGQIDDQWRGHDAIINARDYPAQSLSELPFTAQSLMRGDRVMATETTVLPQ